jgi:hypothetical protein
MIGIMENLLAKSGGTVLMVPELISKSFNASLGKPNDSAIAFRIFSSFKIPNFKAASVNVL